MFTHLVQTYLVVVVVGIVIYALVTWFQDIREEREARRQYTAHFLAECNVMDRVLAGDYDSYSAQDLKLVYEHERNMILGK